MASRTPALPIRLALGSAVVAAACLPLAFFALFAGFASYDDEGYVLLSLQHYGSGGALYEQVYSHYGPAFYALIASSLPLTGLDFTHADGRAFTIGVWLATSVLCGVATYRLSANALVALGAQLMAFLALVPLRNEPMHPGGLLCLLLAAIVLAGSFLGATARPAIAALIGGLLALVMLTKINVGVFALVSIAFALLAADYPPRRRRALQLLAAAAMLGVAPALMFGRYEAPGVARYGAVVVLAAFTVVLTELTRRPPSAAARGNLVALALGFAAAGAVVCLRQVWRGTGVAALVQGVLLDPMRFPADFSIPVRLPAAALGGALLSVLLCLLVASVRGGWVPAGGRVAALRAPAQLLAGVLIWLATLRCLSLEVFTVALPLLWVALAPPIAAGVDSSRRPGTSLLLAVAVLQTLHAYPVAGSQRAWATFLFIPVGALGIAEGWRGLAAARSRHTRAIPHGLARAVPALAAAALLVGGGSLLLQRTVAVRAEYEAWVPLALPGTERIRVPEHAARRYQWLTATLGSRCKSFISMPGFASLYLFTGVQPPSLSNTNNWMAAFDAPRQALVRDAFARMPAPRCVIRNEKRIEFWSPSGRARDGPLARYIADSFVAVDSHDGFELMLQR